MPTSQNDPCRNAALDAVTALFNSGTLDLYTGSAPGASNAATGTLVASIALPATPFASASGGSASKSGTWSTTATGTGTVGYARFVSSDTTKVMELSVGAVGSGADFELASWAFTAGDPVNVTSYTLTEPAS